ncbi:MAG: adenylosuccinate lyase [Candidatus Methylacidiphilales bacterium]|nr:adenylosuccinate lyase [Candidatus Methylacidiphilales bacterium]
MISRYSRPAMTALWTEEAKLDLWLEIEVSACEGMAALGVIPKKDASTIRKKARYRIEEVRKNEERTHHDVLAFLEEVAVHVGPAGRWIHQGLTSSDLLDTTLAVQCVRAADILLEDLGQLRDVIARKARKYQLTPMIGRSHGIHAEPVTYGLKLALMYEEFGRSIDRLVEARKQIAVGKLSGAVGTHAHLDPRVETHVCQKLGLKAAHISTQIIQRDRHAHFMTTLALIASSIDRWATEFRHLQRTEVLEVEEYFSPGQKGSSAMPHKRNPIIGERLSGLARVIRGNAVAALENVPLWHERDISHSSAERVILPDSTILLDYMLAKLTDLVDRQIVYPENMLRNLEITRGLYFSQSVLLALTDRGVARRTAYEVVQRNAMACWRGEGKPFLSYLLEDAEVVKLIKPAELKKICSLDRHFRHVKGTFKKCGL